MKKFALLALAAFAGVSLFGAPTIQVRIYTDKNQVKLTPAKQKTVMRSENPSWDKKKGYSLISYGPQMTAKWVKVDLAFTAENDGKIFVYLRTNPSKKAADQALVYYSNIKINGQLIPNGDLTKATLNKKENRMIPNNFALAKNTKYVAKGGPDGKSGAVEVNYDNYAQFPYSVKAGQTYLIEAMVRLAPVPEIK